MRHNIVAAARRYMHRQTIKNKAPVWELTEIAVAKAHELCKHYRGIDKAAVLTALYLAHVHFGTERQSQRGHYFKSGVQAIKFLNKFNISNDFKSKVVNAIEAHHGHVPCQSLEAEIMKNAEAFKFLTPQGVLIMLYDAAKRGAKLSGRTFEQTCDYTLMKMEQKYKLVTLPHCQREAAKNRKLIMKFFNS